MSINKKLYCILEVVTYKTASDEEVPLSLRRESRHSWQIPWEIEAESSNTPYCSFPHQAQMLTNLVTCMFLTKLLFMVTLNRGDFPTQLMCFYNTGEIFSHISVLFFI